jgi:hypothetical protein
LKKEHLAQNNIKKEGFYLFLFLLLFYLVLQIIYYHEFVFKLFLAYAYLYILPGYALMLYFYDKLDFVYRAIISIGLGFAVQNLLVYSIITLFNLKFQLFYKYTPMIIILVGFAIFYFKLLREK